MDGFTFNLGFNYYLGKSLLNVGIEAVGYNTRYQYTTRYGSEIGMDDHTTDLSLFAMANSDKSVVWSSIPISEP